MQRDSQVWIGAACAKAGFVGKLGPGGGGGAGEQASGKWDVDPRTLAGEMRSEGWMHGEGDKWRRGLANAGPFPFPKIGQVVRRLVRDVSSGQVLEGLWMRPETAQRKRKEIALSKPMGLVVDVGVCEYDGHDEDCDEEPSEGHEATLSSANAAIFNFLGTDMADLRFCE